MKEFLSKYKIEVLILAAIAVVMIVPYFVLTYAHIQSEEKLQQIEDVTKELTPIVIAILCGLIVYRAIKRNREDR